MFPIFLNEFYRAVIDQIISYWTILMNTGEKPETFNGKIYSCNLPSSYLCQLNDWIGEFWEMTCQPSTAKVKMSRLSSALFGIDSIPMEKICSKSIIEYREMLSRELQTLLPAFRQSEAAEILSQKPIDNNVVVTEKSTYEKVTAILPVLVSGYIQKRRGDKGKKTACEDPPRFTGQLFSCLAFHEKDADMFKRRKESACALFRPKCWSDQYSDLKYAQLTASKAKNKLKYFGNVMLFLFLAYKMKDFCNLSLSCDLFEDFSGSIGFFDEHFPRLEEGYIYRGTSDDPRREEIISYLDKMFNLEIDQKRRADLWNNALNRYLAFAVQEIVLREEGCLGRKFSDDELGKSKWAKKVMNCALVVLCPSCQSNESIFPPYVHRYFKLERLEKNKKRKGSLHKTSSRCSKYNVSLGGWIKSQKIMCHLKAKIAATPKLKKMVFAAHAGIKRLANQPRKYIGRMDR